MAKRHILEHVFCVTARFFFEKFQTTLYKEEFFRKKKFYSRGYRAFRLCYGGNPTTWWAYDVSDVATTGSATIRNFGDSMEAAQEEPPDLRETIVTAR